MSDSGIVPMIADRLIRSLGKGLTVAGEFKPGFVISLRNTIFSFRSRAKFAKFAAKCEISHDCEIKTDFAAKFAANLETLWP